MSTSDLVRPDRVGYSRAQKPETGTTLNDERTGTILKILIEAGGQIEGYSVEKLSGALGLSGSATSVVIRRMDAAGMIGRLREGNVSYMWLRGPGLDEALRLELVSAADPEEATAAPAAASVGSAGEPGSDLVDELARLIAPAVRDMTTSLAGEVAALEVKLRDTEGERDRAVAEVVELRPYRAAYEQIRAVTIVGTSADVQEESTT